MARPITDEMIEYANKHYREDLRNALCESCKRRIHIFKKENIKLFKVVNNKQFKGNYSKEFSHTNKTYIKITKEDYEYIVDLAEKGNSDFVEKDGILYTFGNYEKKYALIPYYE